MPPRSFGRLWSRAAIPAAAVSAALAVGTWFGAPAAMAQPSPQAHSLTTLSTASASPKMMSTKAALAYWTAARMRSAKPVDMVAAGKAPHLQRAVAHPTGKRGTAPGGLPTGASLAGTHASAAALIHPDTWTYPYPYDSFTPTPASIWKKYPYEVNGKIFFTNGGGNYVCSGTVVGSATGSSNENEVWTAGHCLVNTDVNNQTWDSSAIFVPAYNGNLKAESGYAPYGEFVYTGAAIVASAWYNNRDLTQDEGAFTVGTSSTTGAILGNAVGWSGFAWNYPVNQQFVQFGYPAQGAYNGKNLIENIGATAGQDTISGADATDPIVTGNPMTPGDSGGAWAIDWTTGGTGYVDGHNDYYYTSQPLAWYSPYQDTLSNTIRCFNASSC